MVSKMKRKPKVFISYSYDSEEHKIWVARLAYDLQNTYKIDVILDQWNVSYGSFLPRFMREGIKRSDRVLVICTEKYVEKSNRKGCGVNLEDTVILNELFKDSYTDKFIPILRHINKKKCSVPDSLEGRKYLDFMQDDRYEDSLKELYREIYRISKRPPIPPKTKTKKVTINYKNISCIIFAAGKGTRTQQNFSKHLMLIENNGLKKPMIFHTLDLVLKLGMQPIVLYGFDGTNLKNFIETEYKNKNIKLLRVCNDDASDLTFNTGGTLIRFQKKILELINNNQHILLTVGDQPHMKIDTIKEFINDYLNTDLDGCILSTNSRGNIELERSTSTRISAVGGEIFFITPPKEQIFDPNTYSQLLDVGVIVLKKSLFSKAVSMLLESDVFGKIINHIPYDKRGIRNIDIYQEINNPEQFTNINFSIEKKNSNILEDWIYWNVSNQRSPNAFSIFDYPDQYSPIFELDTTLICHTTPACGADCTYRIHRSNRIIDLQCAIEITRKAKNTGFSGALFSGGGENLEPDAYPIFIETLKVAKEVGLTNHLATNGLFINEENINELLHNLHSIRFSINPIFYYDKSNHKNLYQNGFSHLGILSDRILLSRKIIDKYNLPTKLFANILLSPETPILELESSILMLSNLGVDGIRIKPKHIFNNGCWDVDPQLYKQHLYAINNLKNNKEYSLPSTSFPKLEHLLDENFPNRLSLKCWYRDFNPLVIGCDCISYSCCEMKYENRFIRKTVDLSKKNFNYILQDNTEPQSVIPRKCFRGCKGYILNQMLQQLLDDYRQIGRKLFSESVFTDKSNLIIESLSRLSLSN
jgi:NDP-sugar pyrophosphorylase family protein